MRKGFVPECGSDSAVSPPRQSTPAVKDERCAIRIAARRSGLTTHVIRAWERRYQAVMPDRTGSARRCFSEGDVRRLTLLRQAVEHGHRISDVVGLPWDELYDLVARDTLPGLESFPRIPYSPSKLVEMAIEGASTLQAAHVRQALLQATRILKTPALFEEFLLPLQAQIGAPRQNGPLRTSSQRFVESQIRDFLAQLLKNSGLSSSPRSMYVASYRPAYENDALMAAVTAKHAGWEVTYLGSHLPADEIVYATSLRQVQAVIISLGDSETPRDAKRYFQELRQRLAPTVTIHVIGAANSADLSEMLIEQDISVPNSISMLCDQLCQSPIRSASQKTATNITAPEPATRIPVR